MKLLSEDQYHYLASGSSGNHLAEIIGKTAPIFSASCSIALTNLEAGASVSKHHHFCTEEIYIFIKGCCKLLVNGKPVMAEKGTVLVIEAGERHEILPVDCETVFYAISLPPFSPDDYLTE